ncbi:MAG: hypothetical protein QHH07_12925 [Sedimentisphaerales bacterium]|nr:hypothetical protein [Sedimentisphaerales bacterium]
MIRQLFRAALSKGLGIWERIGQRLSSTRQAAAACHLAAEAYRLLGDEDKALEVYEHVVSTWPGYEYGWLCQYRLIKAYKGLLADGQVQADPQLLAQIDSRLQTEYRRLLELYPTSPPARSIGRLPRDKGLVGPSGTQVHPSGPDVPGLGTEVSAGAGQVGFGDREVLPAYQSGLSKEGQ